MIKFKAFSKTLNRWLKPEDIMVNGYGDILGRLPKGDWDLVDDVIICRYTGLEDRNGKPIYEGNILECFNDPLEWESKTKKVVQWDTAGWNLSYSSIVYSVVGHILEQGVPE